MGFIWSSKLASVFRLSGLLVIDSALDAAIKKVCKQHELIASVWYDKILNFLPNLLLKPLRSWRLCHFKFVSPWSSYA